MSASAAPTSSAAAAGGPVVSYTTELEAALLIMEQGLNGDDVYDNNKSLYGFVKTEEYLILPGERKDYLVKQLVTVKNTDPAIADRQYTPEFPNIAIEDFQKPTFVADQTPAKIQDYTDNHAYVYPNSRLRNMQITLMNYHQLVASGMYGADAYLVACFRCRWIILGMLTVRLQDTSGLVEEITFVKANARGSVLEQMAAAKSEKDVLNVDPALGAQYVKYSLDTEAGYKFVVANAEIVIAIVEYMMRTRGHHYKIEYAQTMTKFYESCHESTRKWPSSLDMKAIFRTAIHPFGLKALPVMVAHFVMYGKLPNAVLFKLSGAPNGMAVLTTTLACLKAMRSEAWWGSFEKVYATQLAEVKHFSSVVLSQKYNFHMACRLYGMQPITSTKFNGVDYTVDQMRESGTVMASMAQGYINAMSAAKASNDISSFSFENAALL